jgi:hypothetical protein
VWSPATSPGQACVISGFGGAAGCAIASEGKIECAIAAKTNRTIHPEMFILTRPA